MRRARRKRLVIGAREHFRDVSKRAIEGKQSVCPEVRVGRKGTVIAILTGSGPACEERPDGSEMIAAAAEFRRMLRNNPHAPVRLVIQTSELRNHRVRFRL